MTEYTSGDLLDHEAVAAVIKDPQGDILMFQHKKFGFWTIPIGKAEPGETPYEGMLTEVSEECGINVVSAVEIASRPYTYKRDGNDVNLISHIYEVTQFDGTPRNAEPHKHLEMRFMPVSEIVKLKTLSDATLLFLEVLGITRPANL